MFTQDPLYTSQKRSLLHGKVLPTLKPAGFIPNPHPAGSEPSTTYRGGSSPTTPTSVNIMCQVEQKSVIAHDSRPSVFSDANVDGRGKPETNGLPNNQIIKASSTLLSRSKYETHYTGVRPANQASFLSLLFSKKESKTSWLSSSSSTIQPEVIETPKPACGVERGMKIENKLSNVKSTLYPPPALTHTLPTTNHKLGSSLNSRENVLRVSPSRIVKSEGAGSGTVKTQGVTNAPYSDIHHLSSSIKSPAASRDAMFLEQWSTTTKARFGSLKQGLNAVFAIKDDNTERSKSKSTPLTPEQKPATLLPCPVIVLRRELPDHHHGNQPDLKETPMFSSDPFAAGSPSHPIESEYFSPSGSPDLDGTPKAAYQAKSTDFLSLNSNTGLDLFTFPTHLGEENGTVSGNQTKNSGLSASRRDIESGLHIISDLSTVPASLIVNQALLSPRPQYGRKISEPSVPSRDNLAQVVTRSRSNTTASDQLFMGNNGTFFVEPHPTIKAPLDGPAQSSLSLPNIEPSLSLWRRRAASKLARTGKATSTRGPTTILVPGSSEFDDEDAYDLQYTMKTLSAGSRGLFPSQEETITPVRSNFNGSNHSICESGSEDGLATPKASDFARKCTAQVTAASKVSNDPDQALPSGSAFEIERRDSKVSPTAALQAQEPPIVGLASDIISCFPDPPRWVLGSPPRSAFDDYDDDDAENTEIYIGTLEEANTHSTSIP